MSSKILLATVTLLHCVGIITSQNAVNVSVYYESLCPDCRSFDKWQLFPTYENLREYINLKLVPYGNAKRVLVNNTWEFTCQHGPEECFINKVQACVLCSDAVSQFQRFSFIGCIMSSEDPGSIQLQKACASWVGMNWYQINSCASGEKGNELLAKFGAETDALNPPHEYVPWILFNGKYNSTMNSEAVDNLQKVICNLLDNKPEQCSQDEPLVFQLL